MQVGALWFLQVSSQGTLKLKVTPQSFRRTMTVQRHFSLWGHGSEVSVMQEELSVIKATTVNKKVSVEAQMYQFKKK